MGKAACRKSPGQLESPKFFLPALFLLLLFFCSHGKELPGQSGAKTPIVVGLERTGASQKASPWGPPLGSPALSALIPPQL